MSFTLIEAAKSEENPLRKGIIETIAKNTPILQIIPLQNILGNAYAYITEGALPGVAFRGLNEAYTEVAGVLNPQVEALKICGGDADVDIVQRKTRPQNSAGDLMGIAIRQTAKALGAFWQAKFFKGDQSLFPKEFDGMERRAIGSQLIDQGATAGGDPLTLAQLDVLLDTVDRPDVLAMNRTMRRKVNSLMRAANQATETVSDAFGRQIPSYAGVPIAVVEEDNLAVEIFQFNEPDSAGDAASCTSIYALRFGEDEYVALLQEESGIDIRRLGELDAKPVERTRVEWIVSPAVFNGRGLGRLRAITNA